MWTNRAGIALRVYQPRLEAKADLLLSRIDSCKDSPIDITELAMFYSFDVMSDVGKSECCRIKSHGGYANSRSQGSPRTSTC